MFVRLAAQRLGVLDALGKLVRVGLDDLDAAADGVTSWRLPRLGRRQEHGLRLDAPRHSQPRGSRARIPLGRVRQAALGVRRGRLLRHVPVLRARDMPKSKITEPKKTKKSYTGGYYKKFQIYMGWKKSPAKIPLNLPADASDSLASPGPGATPRHVDRAPATAGHMRLVDRDRAVAGGPVAAVQHKSPGRMTKEAAQERGIERTFAMFARRVRGRDGRRGRESPRGVRRAPPHGADRGEDGSPRVRRAALRASTARVLEGEGRRVRLCRRVGHHRARIRRRRLA